MSSILPGRQVLRPYVNESTPANFVVRFAVWQHGQRGRPQTSHHLCMLVGGFLKRCFEDMRQRQGQPLRPMLWLVRPVRSARGPAPQPIQVDISCYTQDFYGIVSADEEEEYDRALELIDSWLWRQFLQLSRSNELQNIYEGYLIGFSLKHPDPIHEDHWSYSRCHVEPFHTPEQVELFCETKFYHGPALAISAIADVLSEYGKAVQLIPANSFAPPHVNATIAGIRIASATLPRLKRTLLPVLDKFDRRSIPALVQTTYMPVVRSMEDALAAAENQAIKTCMNAQLRKWQENNPALVLIYNAVTAIYAIYALKSAATSFTSAMHALQDKKYQDAVMWATITLGGALALGTGFGIITLLPTTAFAAAEALEVVGAGACGGAGIKGLFAAVEVQETKRTILLNKRINEKIEYLVYYLALCFMRSSGVLFPRDYKGDLDNALTNMGGKAW